MNTSLRTVSRAIRAAPSLGQGVTHARRMTTTSAPEFPDIRDSAVRDAIMDKLWGAESKLATPSTSAPATSATEAATASTEAAAQPARL